MNLRRRRSVVLLVLVGALVAFGAACNSPAVLAVCAGKTVASNAGPISDPAITEASGLAASVRNPGVLWVHNDSGDSARVFAVGTDGTTRATYTLTGASAVDWEDMAVGPGPGGETSYLYLGDIGDNASARSEIVVYRVAEPTVTGNPGAGSLSDVAPIRLRYPDGAHDSEALFIDPTNGEMYLIEKKLAGGPVGVYRAPANLASGSTTTLTKVSTLSLPAGLANAVTAADSAADGHAIAVRTYGSVLLWDRATGKTPVEILAAGPCRGPVPAEIQGETIAFDADGRGYVTVSEGANATLHRYRAP
ncbi:MAG: hypothetical protein ACXW2C_07875 [Acidimicrobiia bacterium]